MGEMSASKRYENQIQMNRRRRVAGSDTHGDGNSDHLKREPYPFQMSDAIPRVRIRVLDNIWTMSRKYKDNLWTKGRKALTRSEVVLMLSLSCPNVVRRLSKGRLYIVQILSIRY